MRFRLKFKCCMSLFAKTKIIHAQKGSFSIVWLLDNYFYEEQKFTKKVKTTFMYKLQLHIICFNNIFFIILNIGCAWSHVPCNQWLSLLLHCQKWQICPRGDVFLLTNYKRLSTIKLNKKDKKEMQIVKLEGLHVL